MSPTKATTKGVDERRAESQCVMNRQLHNVGRDLNQDSSQFDFSQCSAKIELNSSPPSRRTIEIFSHEFFFTNFISCKHWYQAIIADDKRLYYCNFFLSLLFDFSTYFSFELYNIESKCLFCVDTFHFSNLSFTIYSVSRWKRIYNKLREINLF